MKNLFLTIAATLGLTAAIMAQNVPSYLLTKRRKEKHSILCHSIDYQ
jgi:hypothetical protein